MNKSNKLDFTGQQIYVGMDIHKKSWSISILTDNLEHKTFTQPPHIEVLVKYLKRTFPGGTYKSVYEAGYCGFWIHDRFKEHGVQCLVVNPADVPTKDKERRHKTDRVDCRKLARSLRSGEIGSIYVPSRSKVEDRSLLRSRHSMVRKQTRCKNQIKSLLHFYGIQVPEELTKGHWTKRFLSWIESIRLQQASGNVALRVHLEELNHMRKILVDITRSIRSLANTEEYRQNVHLLKTVPGISTLTAMTLLTELYDIRRFKNLDKLCSYIGLIPDTDSSGETERRTGITKRRNAHLRGILIESSWVAVRKDPALLMTFQTLCKRMPKTNAIVRIARKLLNRIKYVLRTQQEYVPAVVR
ncbi:MAG: IS110 family transposase [Deltaproteobacteria bacterium]|nr:IS110 family transposase [Deltaproteobacteria bacterium]